jgi:hypothetical protein
MGSKQQMLLSCSSCGSMQLQRQAAVLVLVTATALNIWVLSA